MKINVKFAVQPHTGLVVRTQVKVGECSYDQVKIAEKYGIGGRSKEERKQIYCDITSTCGGVPFDINQVFGRCEND